VIEPHVSSTERGHSNILKRPTERHSLNCRAFEMAQKVETAGRSAPASGEQSKGNDADWV
jgi:hypothetical protein